MSCTFCQGHCTLYAGFVVHFVRNIHIAKKELKDLFDQGLGDLHFDYEVKEKYRKKVISLEFKVYTRDNEQNQVKITRDDMLHYVNMQMRTYFPKNVDYIARTMEACSLDMETLNGIFEKIGKKIKEYNRSEHAAIIRFVLKEDFQIQ